MRYFKECEDLKQVYKTYKELVKQFHPDISGKDTLAEMQAVNQELAFIKDRGLESYQAKQKEDNGLADIFEDLKAEKDSALAQLLVFGINNDIDMEFIGHWLWFSGNTKPYKDDLKELGAKFSGKHKKWYYSGTEWKPGRSKHSYKELKDIHGVKKVTANFKRIAA